MAFRRRTQTPTVQLGPPIGTADPVFVGTPVGGININIGPFKINLGESGGVIPFGTDFASIAVEVPPAITVPLFEGGPSLGSRIAAADAAAEAAICPCS